MSRTVWIAGVIALVAVILFIIRTANDNKRESPAPPVVPRQEPQPQAVEVSLQCPVCEGHGYLVAERVGRMRRRICQLCAGKGGRVLRIPPGNARCAECQGFGQTEGRGGRYVMCVTCRGKGYVKAPFEPSD